MNNSFIYFLLFNVLFLAILVLVCFLFIRKFRKKIQKEIQALAACEQKKAAVYETVTGLTALSGFRSTLEYLGDKLENLGFVQVLILIIDRKERTLNVKIAKGFNAELDLDNIKIPLEYGQGLLTRTLLQNQYLTLENQSDPLLSQIEIKNYPPTGSLMLAPLVKKSEENCWEMFHCGNTSCPAYEKEETYCWTLANTRCASHLRGDFEEKIFSSPGTKLEACLTCERFESLGVISVAKDKFIKFSSDEKKIFKTLTYQAGAKLERALLRSHLEERERELSRRMYESSILRELGERIGYSLNIQKIADIIINSLKKLIDYSAASYLLILPEENKLLFKCQIEEMVSRSFIESLKERTLAGLSALLNKDLNPRNIEESLAGTILNDNLISPVRSFFNIPLTLGEKVVGVLNVSSTRPGLYKEEEMTILYKITAQASNAVTRLKEVLDTEQEKMNAMVSSMADGVLMVDTENRIYVLNPRLKKMLGLEEKPTFSLYDVFDALSNKMDFRTKLEECLKLDRLLVTDELFINSHFLRILFSPVKNKASQILGALTIFHDITHDKELEKMREDFTNMMVHDLRSPLNGIRLMSELIQRKKQTEEETKKNVALIHESASSLLELVNDLLDVAKIESGKFDINKQLDNLSELIYNQIDFFRALAQDRNINLTTQIARALPLFKFDAHEIKQALGNLLSNGVKFNDPGGNVIVQALPYQKGERLEEKALKAGINWFLTQKNKTISSWKGPGIICAVTDSGPGIPAEQIPRLFNKFEQIKSEKLQKSRIKGTGLGLVIAKGIVEAHGGVIDVESKVDKGSTFFFILPLED